MPSETLSILIEAQNRASPVFRAAKNDVTDLSSALRGLQGASRELDLFGALPGRLGTQVSYLRSAIGDITRAFGDMKGAAGGGAVGEQLAGMGYKLSDDVLRLNADLLQTGAASTVAARGLGALAPIAVMGGVALAGAALAAGKAAVELGNYGQIVVQTERKFAAFSGGTAQAADNLAAMRAATEDGLPAMSAMSASSMLLSMGLADTGEKAAQLARLAVMLGPAWRDAETNIRDFTMLLANQSIRRLDQFGLSVEGVRAKQRELMEQGFAKDLAFTNAVIEIGAQKMLQLEKAGVVAATGTAKLTAAWADLRMEISKPFAQPVSELEAALARELRRITTTMQIGSGDPFTRLQGLQGRQDQFLSDLAAIQKQPSLIPTAARTDYQMTVRALREVNRETSTLQQEMFNWNQVMDMTLQNVPQLDTALYGLDAQIKAVSASFAGLGKTEFAGLLDREIKTWQSALAKLQGQLLTYNMEQQQLREALERGDTRWAAILRENLAGIDLDKLKTDIAIAENNLQGLTIQKRDVTIKILLEPEPTTLMDTYYNEMMLRSAQLGPLPIFAPPGTYYNLPGYNETEGQFGSAYGGVGIPGKNAAVEWILDAAERDRENDRLKRAADKEAAAEWKRQAEKVGDAWKSAVGSIPGLPGNLSKVTEADMAKAKAGLYDPKVDEKLRQFKDLIYNPEGAKKGNYGFSIADMANAAGLGGLAGGNIDTLRALYAMVEEQWNTGEFFEKPENLKWLNKDAGMADLARQARAAQGKQNVFGLFGVKDENSAMMLEALGLNLGPEVMKKILPTEKEAVAFKKSLTDVFANAKGAGTDVLAATIYGADGAGAQTQKMTDTGTSMGGMLIAGIKKAEPDLWTAGYNAAMAMQAGWNAAQSGKPPPGNSSRSSYTGTERNKGL